MIGQCAVKLGMAEMSSTLLLAPCAGKESTHSLLDLHSSLAAGTVPYHGHRETPLAVGGGRHGDKCDGVWQGVQRRVGRAVLQHGRQHYLLVAAPADRGQRNRWGSQ